MSNIPDPPTWEMTQSSFELPTDIATDIEQISVEGFFNGTDGMKTETDDREYEIIGKGTGRIVITSAKMPDRTVAKVPRPGKNHFNSGEIFTYNSKAPQSVKPYLTPVLEADPGGNGWLVTVKCETGDRETAATIRDILNHYGVSCEMSEVVAPNVGTYNGAPCVIDYDNLF
jgi:hypothetical protein